MGVDAAYHGMEIQILDHDAPIYKNLRIYQQHGSVYGIIRRRNTSCSAIWGRGIRWRYTPWATALRSRSTAA